MMFQTLNIFFDSRRHYGTVLLRLIVGWRLISGSWGYAFFNKPISEVEQFFNSLDLPFPLVCAFLSVYAQFICGILFILGLWVRPAALVMIFNFTVAIIAAHMQDPIQKSFDAWVMLAAAVVFLFYGAGNLSLDNLLERRNTIKATER